MSRDSICSENGLEFNKSEGVHFTVGFYKFMVFRVSVRDCYFLESTH